MDVTSAPPGAPPSSFTATRRKRKARAA